MTTQGFFSFGSASQLFMSATSSCERNAELAGMKKLAAKPCPVPDRYTPICITAVYMRVIEQYSDGRCRIEVVVCYTYSYSEMKRRLDNEPLASHYIMLGSGERFRSTPSLGALPSTEYNPILFHPNTVGGDIVEETATFNLLLNDGETFDTVLIADIYTGDKFSDLVFNQIKCPAPDESNTEPLIKRVTNACGWCTVELQGLSEYDRPLLRVKYADGSELYNATLNGTVKFSDGSEMHVPPSNGDTIVLPLIPCELLSNGGSIAIQPINKGIVKYIKIPPSAWTSPISAEDQKSNKPELTITKSPAPGHPCRYQLSIKTAFFHIEIWIMKGLLTTDQYNNFQSWYNNGSQWHDDPPKLGSLELISSMSVPNNSPYPKYPRYPPGFPVFKFSRTVSSFIDGPGEFTVVTKVGTCFFAFPVKLTCDISDKKDDRPPAVHGLIKADRSDESLPNSFPSNSSTLISPIYSDPYIKGDNNTIIANQGRDTELTSVLTSSPSLITPVMDDTTANRIPLKTKLWPPV